MSLENEAGSSEKHAGTLCELQKHSKISYTRDFLLSLSELDICKRLPSGFDQSILSEFEDAFHGVQDRQRIGNSPLQSFRRGEYGSSPPSKGDSSSYSRGIYGRWENRSSSRDDRDTDSQSDWSSESGRRYGNQSRRPWQSSEHDGLLGSGSFPKSSGYAPGIPIPKVRANDHYQLNKSNEPYHPPRPYKAVPHTRTHDSFNDETFGSSESTSEDKVNEERKRRASFELMRKEQHKAMQEKQKSSDKNRNDTVLDNAAFLDDAKDGKRPLDRSNELDGSVIPEVSNNDVGKSSSPSQTSGYRPLVPPGFTSTVLEKNSGTKSSIRSHLTEIVKSENEGSLFQPRVSSAQNGTLSSQEERQSVEETDLSVRQLEDTNIHARFFDKGEKVVNPSSALEMSSDKSLHNQLRQASSLSESQGTLDTGETNLNTEEVRVHKIIGEPNRDHSTSILQKLFGSALTENTGGSSGLMEVRDGKPDGKSSPYTAQSSKFAQWFLDEEKKPGDELVASTRPSDLLSLIGGGGEKAGLQVSDVQASEHRISPHISFQNSEHVNRHMTPDITRAAATGIPDQLYACDKQDKVVPNVLTCEDLEQTILSELSESYSTVQGKSSSLSGAKIEHPKAEIDNRASQHLLSLLHKGTGQAIPSNPVIESSEVANKGHASVSLIESKVTNIQKPDNNLTLETLFGTAFMKELQSVDAPVSVQRGPVGSTRIDIPVPTDHFRVGEIEPSRKSATELDKIERLFGFNEPQREAVDSSTKHGGFDGSVEIQFPEEESLFLTSGNSTKGGQEGGGPSFVGGPHNHLMSSSQFQASQLNHGRPLFHQLDSHPAARVNSQMKFMAPENSSIMRHDAAVSPIHNHQFPGLRPPFHRPNSMVSEFESHGHHRHHHPMLQQMQLQQMQMGGNLPSPHLLQEFYKGSAPVPRPSTQQTGFIHELMNPMQGGFPLNQRQPTNIGGGLGMRLSGSDDNISGGGGGGGGSNRHNPDVIQRLIEMEMRAKSKQQQQMHQHQHHHHHPYHNYNHQGQGGPMYEGGGDMSGFHYR